MKRNLRSLVLSVALTTLFIGSVSAEIPEDIDNLVRIGLGYQLSEGTTVLGDELPVSDPSFQYTMALPEFPSTCFEEPGITNISGINITEPREILINTYAIGLAVGLLEVHCSGASVVTFPVLEIPLEEGYHRFNNPQDHVTNAYLEESILLLLSRDENFDGIIAERSERGGLDFVNRGPLSVGVRSIQGAPHALYYMRFSGDSTRDRVYEILAMLDCVVQKGNDRISGNPTILVDGGVIDPSAILGSARSMLAVAFGLNIPEFHAREFALEDALSRYTGNGAIQWSPSLIASEIDQDICQ